MTDKQQEVQRYDFANRIALPHRYESDSGEWVRYSDYAALSAEAQRLRDALNALYVQALQSNVNEPSNEYGREALGMARAALNQERT